MEQIISILDKIGKIASAASCSTIEKDLMLQYTRDLYETILSLEDRSAPVVQELTDEPEPLPEEVIEESEPAESILPEAVEVSPESATLQPEQQEVRYEGEEGRVEVEELYIQDEPDRSAFYPDIAAQAEEELPTQILSFELEPELREEKPAPFQARHSTDFRVWNKDIRSYIGINDKYNFISELFKGNSEAYEEILNEINQCEDKQDALRFLENAGITTLYQWNQEGFSEQIFYNVLSQFFAAR